MLTALLAVAFAAGGADAAPAPGRQQLLDLLGGNTIVAAWDGRDFTQHFDPAGCTRYREGNGPVSFGRWRIDARARYCAVRPSSSGESCYEVSVDENRLLWTSAASRTPRRYSMVCVSSSSPGLQVSARDRSADPVVGLSGGFDGSETCRTGAT